MAWLTPEEIASSEVISNLKLSQDGTKLVYCVGPKYKSGKDDTSALWLADTAVNDSARQITSGEVHDYSPSFHPVSTDIYFLSDRGKRGGAVHIYSISSDSSDQFDESKVRRFGPTDDTKTVTSYSISPDGQYIAYISKNHPDKDAKEGITIWREKKDLGSIYLQYIGSTEAKVLLSTDAHVDSFSWSPDSRSIIYRLLSNTDAESRGLSVTEGIMSISGQRSSKIFEHPQSPNGRTIWTQAGDLLYVQAKRPASYCSSSCLWRRSFSDQSDAKPLAYGETEDVVSIVDLGKKSQYAVEVAFGLDTRLDVFDEQHEAFTVFSTADDAITSDWDMKLTDDGQYIFAVVLSSSITGKAQNVWSGSGEKGDKGTFSVTMSQLSSHHKWFTVEKSPISRPFYWKGKDGETLQGVLAHPRGVAPERLPTVVVPHGGPYGRDALDLSFSFSGWRTFLATHGYLTLSPNYRGGSGRGDTFAKAAEGGMGTLDWDDVETMIDEAIAQNLVDPNKIGIAGYSQGGFLTAWGCTRPDSRFKAGVVGAGVTDWGLLSETSDMPDFEAALAGRPPWKAGEAIWMNGSPIKDAKYVKAPLLFIHGKEDKRVPISQAIALLRGVERESTALKPTLVMYPREDHGFKEHEHAEDVLKRVLEFLDKHLKQASRCI